MFARFFESGLGSCVIRLGYFDCVAEHCVRLITGQHANVAVVVDLCVVHLLEVGAKLFGDSVREHSETSGVVLEAFLAWAILDDDLAAERLVVFGADVVVVIAVLDLDRSFGDGWSSGNAGLCCLTRCR